MGNRAHGEIGYRGMGSRGIWGNRVQGYGVQDTWAIGTLSGPHGSIGYRGYGVKRYGHMGQ